MASSLDPLLRYGWHEWLCKTNFSFLVGASHPGEVVTEARQLGYRSLCINDYDGVYGLARAYRAQRSAEEQATSSSQADHHQPGLRLHYGAEIHLQNDHEAPLLLQDTLVLVAQNWQGYHNLCRLLSQSHLAGKSTAHLPLAHILASNVDGLVAIQPMRGLLRQPSSLPMPRFADVRDHFQGRFYFAVSCHLHPAEDHWIPRTLKLAELLQAPCLLSQDAFFHRPERKYLSDLVHAIRHNLTLDEAGAHFFPNCERYLHRLPALAARYRDLSIYESALKASHDLAASCQFDLGVLRYHYPQEMIPAHHSAQSYLEELTWEGAKRCYKQPLPAKITAILSHELRLIEQLEFADYFLTVWDIVRWARCQGILCQGRGSAANSAVCFVLGITAVDPTLFDLLFERFISRERGDPPDIDVDFEHERREEVIQYIYERYGRQRAAMVANVITFRRKGALRAVGKALAVPEALLGEVSRLSGSKLLRQGGSSGVLAMAAESLPPAAEAYQASIPWQLWGEMSDELRGFPRHLGIHSGGFMLANQELNWLVAQEPATMAGRSVIQWCKEDIEALGFFKIDILALGMLSALRKGFDYVKRYYDTSLSLCSIPHDDQPTYQMIQRADTVGTFQIESRAQMSMLPRLRPRCFYDLVIEVAIIRPGPIQGQVIHPYLQRREGKEPITFPSESLRPILARTLGIAIFQEQAMRIAIAVGNFTAGEANELRKHIGAWSMKSSERDLNPWLRKLADGMRSNGFNEDFINQILGQMRGFAEYGFPESHAVSFALIAYASSYLKCHYPAAFYTGVLNSQPMGFYSAHALLEAAKRDGVEILPMSVNHSDWDHRFENRAASGKPAVYGIRLGLRLVTGLRAAGVERLLRLRAKRAGGVFASWQELLSEGALFRSDLTALAAADAFHCLGLSRLEALWQAAAAPLCSFLKEEEESLLWPVEDSLTRMQRDFAASHTTLGPHPATIIRQEHWTYEIASARLTPAERLASLTANQLLDVFGMILIKQAPPSAKGMVFLTLEDHSGFINLVLTPQTYSRFHGLIEKASFLCVRGKLQKAAASHSLLVQYIYPPQEAKAAIKPIQRSPAPGSPQSSAPTAAPAGSPRVNELDKLRELYKPRNFH